MSSNWGAVQNGLGAAGKGIKAYGGIQSGNYLYGGLNAAATLPFFANQFPQTFDPNTYQDPSSKAVVNGINTVGKYAGAGLDAYSIYGNLKSGNYLNAGVGAQQITAFGQKQGLIPDSNNFMQTNTGLKPVDYGEGADATSGYAPYLTAPVGAYQAFKDFKNGDYFGGALNAVQSGQSVAQIYNTYFPAGAQLGTQAAAAGATDLGVIKGPGTRIPEVAADGSFLGTLGDIAGYAGLAYAGYQAGKNLFDGDLSGEDKAKETRQQVENAAASYYTFGLSSVAQLADQKLLGGAGEKLRDKYEYYANPASYVSDKIIGAGLNLVGSHKGERQQIRDKFRDIVSKDPNIKLFDEKFQGTLADGTTVDFGKDKYSFDAGGSGDQNIDLTTKEGADAAAFGDVIAGAQGLKGKEREALAALFAGAALKNGKGKPEVVAANGNHFLSQLGLDKGSTQQLLNKQVVDKKISKEDYAAFSATLNRLGKKGGNPEARQLSPEEIDQASGKESPKIVGTDPKTGKPLVDMPIDFADTDGRPDTGKRLPTAAEKEFKSTKGPAISDSFGAMHGGPGKPGIAPDGINKTMTYPDGTVMTTLIGVIKPADKVNQNLASGKPPSMNLSSDDIRKLYTDAAKSSIVFRRS